MVLQKLLVYLVRFVSLRWPVVFTIFGELEEVLLCSLSWKARAGRKKRGGAGMELCHGSNSFAERMPLSSGQGMHA